MGASAPPVDIEEYIGPRFSCLDGAMAMASVAATMFAISLARASTGPKNCRAVYNCTCRETLLSIFII